MFSIEITDEELDKLSDQNTAPKEESRDMDCLFDSIGQQKQITVLQLIKYIEKKMEN